MPDSRRPCQRVNADKASTGGRRLCGKTSQTKPRPALPANPAVAAAISQALCRFPELTTEGIGNGLARPAAWQGDQDRNAGYVINETLTNRWG